MLIAVLMIMVLDAYTLDLRVATPDNEEVYLALTEVEEQSSRLQRIPTFVSGKRPGKMIRWQAPAGYVSMTEVMRYSISVVSLQKGRRNVIFNGH